MGLLADVAVTQAAGAEAVLFWVFAAIAVGSGIAMVSMRNIVHASDGPETAEAESGSAETRMRSPASAVSRRLLVAEDTPVNQLIIRGFLEREGHEVTVVSDGYEAIEALRKARFDAVLMDVQMPRLDGVSATRAIRSLGGAMAQVPIIALTANAMAGDRERFLETGMNDYVSKPIDRRELAAAVQRVCDGPDVLDLAG